MPLNLKCMFWFSLQILSEAVLILKRTERDIIKKNPYRSSCKVPAVLVKLQWNLNFLSRFLENVQISNFFKKKSDQREPSCSVRTVGQKDKQTDGRTDRYIEMTKIVVTFRNFANSSRNWTIKPAENNNPVNTSRKKETLQRKSGIVVVFGVQSGRRMQDISRNCLGKQGRYTETPG